MSDQPIPVAAQNNFLSPEDRLITILNTRVPSGSSLRQDWIKELFSKLLTPTQAEMLLQKLKPKSDLYKMMRRKLSRKSVQPLISLLVDRSGISLARGTNSRALHDGRPSRQSSSADTLEQPPILDKLGTEDPNASTASIPAPPTYEQLYTKKPMFKGFSASRPVLSDVAKKSLESYRNLLKELLDSDDGVKMLYARNELDILNVAEAYGMFHGWALMFASGNINEKDISIQKKKKQLFSMNLIEGSRYNPVQRLGNKTYIGVYRSKVFEVPEVMTLIQGMNHYRAAFWLGVDHGLNDMKPTFLDYVLSGVEGLTVQGDFASMGKYAQLFFRASRTRQLESVLRTALPMARLVSAKGLSVARSGGLIALLLGTAADLLRVLKRNSNFRTVVINAIRNANPGRIFRVKAYQAHHLVSVSSAEKGALFLAGIARRIFDPSHISNGLLLARKSGQTSYKHPVWGLLKNLPKHRSGHPKYLNYVDNLHNEEIIKLIGKRALRMSDKQLVTAIRKLTDRQIKAAIKRIQKKLIKYIQSEGARLPDSKLAEPTPSTIPDQVPV